GVYVREDPDGPLVFRALPTPTHAEVADVARRTARRIERILEAHGRWLDPEMAGAEPHPLELDEPGLAACYRAAALGLGVAGERAGKPTLRLILSPEQLASAEHDAVDEPVAEVRGINVHARHVVDGRDRRRSSGCASTSRVRPSRAAASSTAPMAASS